MRKNKMVEEDEFAFSAQCKGNTLKRGERNQQRYDFLLKIIQHTTFSSP